GIGEFGDGFHDADAGIVDESVEAAPSIQDRLNPGRGHLRVADVTGADEDVARTGAAESGFELIENVARAGEQGQANAAWSEGLGEGTPDTRRGAGDGHDGFGGQVQAGPTFQAFT